MEMHQRRLSRFIDVDTSIVLAITGPCGVSSYQLFGAVQAVNNDIPRLVRTMGSSQDLLDIISDPPAGSENLLMQVLIVDIMVLSMLPND